MRPLISSFSLAPAGPVPGDSSKPPGHAHCAEIAIYRERGGPEAVHARSGTLLADALAGGMKGNILLISHPSLSLPEGQTFSAEGPAFGVAVCVRKGAIQAGTQAPTAIECDSTALPFQDESFRTVALYHVVGDGAEPELDEACRVLAPGGELVVVGLNRNSWSGTTQHRHGPLPLIQHGKLMGRLRQHEMEIVAELGVGLLGRVGPRMERYRWSGLGLAFADLLLLHIKHRDRAIPVLPGLKKYPAGAMPVSFLSG